MKADQVERIAKEISEEQFLREALLRLSLEKETPVDVLDSKFEPIVTVEKEYLLVDVDVECSYTCSVGYNREESYYENGHRYTRTVTDWRPFSGNNSSREKVYVSNAPSQEGCATGSIISTCIKDTKQESIKKVDEEIEIYPEALDYAREVCLDSCYSRVDLPGDEQRDEDYSGSTTINSVLGAIIPEYEMEYTYNEQKYKVNGFACGNSCMDKTYPSTANTIKENANKKFNELLQYAICSFCIGLILAMFSILRFVQVVAILGSIVLFVIYFLKKREFKENEYMDMRRKKREKLIQVLKDKNLPELTVEEIEYFDKKV